MVKRCAWGTCKTDSRYPERLIKGGKVIKFHLFLPRKKLRERRDLWVRSCSRADDFKCTKDSYICRHAACILWERTDRPTKIQILFQLQLVEKKVFFVYTVCLHITFYSVI